jgi:hypothetical protein
MILDEAKNILNENGYILENTADFSSVLQYLKNFFKNDKRIVKINISNKDEPQIYFYTRIGKSKVDFDCILIFLRNNTFYIKYKIEDPENSDYDTELVFKDEYSENKIEFYKRISVSIVNYLIENNYYFNSIDIEEIIEKGKDTENDDYLRIKEIIENNGWSPLLIIKKLMKDYNLTTNDL